MISEDLESLLHKAFSPEHLEVEDDSAKHRGHAQASGGGHFKVFIVSGNFRGRSMLERHRMVYQAVEMSKNEQIHALSIRALDPDEWRERQGKRA